MEFIDSALQSVTAQSLKDKYEADLKTLKENCKHPDISDWMKQEWAPGHSTGSLVKICNVCWSKVDEKNDFTSYHDQMQAVSFCSTSSLFSNPFAQALEQKFRISR